MLGFWFKITLWKRVLGALLLGLLVGLLWGEGAEAIRWIGDLFVRAVRMLVVPLVFATIVSGVVAMGNVKKLGSIGIKAGALYLGTTASAITIGLGVGALLRPGDGVDLSGAAAATLTTPVLLADRLLAMVPENPVAALAEGDILAVILFAILFGVGILMAGARARVLKDSFEAASEVMLKLTFLVMELAPFGVFALIAWIAGTKGAAALLNALALGGAVYLACAVHILLVQYGLVRIGARLPLMPFVRGAVEPQLLAYSTSSSAATLPVTMAAAEENLGIRPAVRGSVLPLGATVNMDGTALYVGIVTLFAAQAFGIALDVGDYLVIGLTTTLVSIGTASVPSASLFLLAAVLESIGLAPAQTAVVVGFILPFDRILDMMRTMVNVTGDLSVATVVAAWDDELDRKIYEAAPDI